MADYATGQQIGQWTSPDIPVGASVQYAISEIESAIGGFTKPDYYSVSAEAAFPGYLKHVLWRPTDGTLTNLSTCSAGVTANTEALINVHWSLINDGYPSTIAANNTAAAAATVDLGVHDARDGTMLGTYTTGSILAGGQAILSVPDIEADIGLSPTANMNHYVVKVEGTFTGFLQHLVNNVQVGVITDMTNVCSFDAPPAAQTYVSNVPNPRFGAPCTPGQITLDGYLLVCSSSGTFR